MTQTERCERGVHDYIDRVIGTGRGCSNCGTLEERDCELALEGCTGEAQYVTASGAAGDTYACGPCMNRAEDVEPADWADLNDLRCGEGVPSDLRRVSATPGRLAILTSCLREGKITSDNLRLSEGMP